MNVFYRTDGIRHRDHSVNYRVQLSGVGMMDHDGQSFLASLKEFMPLSFGR